MRAAASYLFNLTTFSQFTAKRNTEAKGVLYKTSLASYLILAHMGLLAKKEFARQRMEKAYAGKTYDEKVAQVQRDFMVMRPDLKVDASVSSAKATTHQFAETVAKPTYRLDSRFLNKAQLDADACFVDVEANMSFGDLVKFLHNKGYRIPLVPEFLDITVGGAFVGVAIESSGHQFGLFHEHVLQVEVLMPSGELKTMSLKKYSDEFHALPNSNGTLGRIMRLRLPLTPLKSVHGDQPCHPFLDAARKEGYMDSPESAWLAGDKPRAAFNKQATEHVHLKYQRYNDMAEALAELKRSSEAKETDFIESVVLSPSNIVIITGDIVEHVNDVPAKRRHDYQTRDIFYQQVTDKECLENYVPLKDYYARWHQTVFWNTQSHEPLAKLLNHPTFRKLFGRFMGPGFLAMLSGARDMWVQHTTPVSASPALPVEHMVQDIGIPQSRALEFSRWYNETINLYPVWLCPVQASDGSFPSFAMKAEGSYVDWGMFNGEGKLEIPGEPKHYTRAIERKLAELGGNKALYSDNAQTRAEFADQYNTEAYDAMKAQMDPDGIYPPVYDKMVKAQLDAVKNCSPHQNKLPFSLHGFMLLTQCLSVSVTSSVLAAFALNYSLLSMSALGLAVGVGASQASRLFGRVVSSDKQEAERYSLGVSGWTSVALLGSSLAVMSQTHWTCAAIAATLLTVTATGTAISARLPAPRMR
ncbi:MAG: FAD-binding protein [Coxiellaceae bacterium]|nr:FAD-binding protein [Coxiellaceae bacterium]